MSKLMDYFGKYKPEIDHRIEKFFDEVVFSREYDVHTEFVLNDILRFIRSGGKRVRPGLVLLGYQSFRGDVNEKVLRASISYEILHAYLLIHDDIMDRDEFRRGEYTVWKSMEEKYKNHHLAVSLAIVAGDFGEALSIKALEWAGLTPEEYYRASTLIHETIFRTGIGQVLDVALAHTPLSDVNREDIIRVYEYKTSYYTLLDPLKLGATLAGADGNVFKDYCIPVGIAFQVRDDILGVFGTSSVTGKPDDSDIREGKRTILVWYAYNHGSDEERRILDQYLGKEDATEEEVNAVREVLVSTGAKEYAQQYAEELSEQGIRAIEEVDIDESVREILKEFAVYVVKREK